MSLSWLYLVAALVVMAFVTFLVAMARYKRCPSDKILVVWGKIGGKQAGKCQHGGAKFIWPMIQDYGFLDLTPMTIDIDLKNALSKQNIRINVPSRFTIAISTEPEIMQLAASRLLSMKRPEIEKNAEEIIYGQLRTTVATMDIEEINTDREIFEKKVQDNVENELKKLGLKLINVNIKDITDESGYIEALGKKAAANAIQQARVDVAEKERDGATGQADAKKIERINVASADATAVEGENKSKVKIAQSNAERREKVAEADKLAVSAEKVNAAKALEEAYVAEQKAEAARREREKVSESINIVVPAELQKEKIRNEAEAEKIRLEQEGMGQGLKVQREMEGQAQGILAILEKKAEGFKKLVDSVGGDPKAAATMLIIEQMKELATINADAIKNIDFGKIVVWDNMGGGNGDGTPITAKFISGIVKSIPPLASIMEVAGLQLPDFLGKKLPDAEDAAEVKKDDGKQAKKS
ncbi:flotillin family protein [Candidatus Woesearchaeota archaeon]|nr:flotillin family protein [Candidatus Woesearchaeota archaeon]